MIDDGEGQIETFLHTTLPDPIRRLACTMASKSWRRSQTYLPERLQAM